MSTVLLVFVGGAVGAPARYLLDRWVQSRHQLRFPLGTLVVNVTGSFVLGLAAGWTSTAHALVGIGFCGGLTTFSTFSVETVELLQNKLSGRAVLYVCASTALAVAAAALGWALGS